MKIEKEHDPEGCDVCRRLGDFTTEQDTAEWLEEHTKAGITLHIVRTEHGNRVTEEEASAR